MTDTDDSHKVNSESDDNDNNYDTGHERYETCDDLRKLPPFLSLLIRLFMTLKNKLTDYEISQRVESAEDYSYFNALYKKFIAYWRAVIFFRCFHKTANLPDCLVMLNPDNSAAQYHDFIGVHLPVVCVADTITDIKMVTYPITSNDDSVVLLLFYYMIFINACKIATSYRYLDFM